MKRGSIKMLRCPATRLRHRLHRSAFTIIELLVVTAVIILLLSIVLIAMNAATKTSQQARTAALMDSIKKGLIRFKGDIGYYPPVMGPGNAPVDELRRLFQPPDPTGLGGGAYNGALQDWWSSCVIAEYLIGYGNHRQDGYGRVDGAPPISDWAEENPPLGIRPPGPDGIWGAGNGPIGSRMGGPAYAAETNALARDQGKVYGPYFELKDERLLGSTDGSMANGNPRIFFPGDPGYNPTHPHILVDYWGSPIRYYRRPYPPGALNQSYRANTDINRDGVVNDADRIPRLSDVFVLRPQTIKIGAEVDGLSDGNGSSGTTAQLESAEFAILSAGADRRLNQNITVDAEGFNKDNIVEVGP
jgi:type II secretory pathway pseudopilin PulG